MPGSDARMKKEADLAALTRMEGEPIPPSEN